MQLRRFTADSTPAALGAVRLALGEDAIILANRRVGDQVEIIATGQMDDASTLAEVSFDNFQSKSQTGVSDAQGGSVSHANSQYSAGVQSRPSQTDRTTTIEELSKAVQESSAPSISAASSSHLEGSNAASRTERSSPLNTGTDYSIGYTSDLPGNAKPTIDARGGRDTSADQLEAIETAEASILGPVDPALPSYTSGFDGEDARVLQALASQAEMINLNFRSLAVNLWGANSPNHSTHLQRLISLGIGAELAVRLVERADPEMTVEHAMRHSLALLKSSLPIGTDKTFDLPGVTIASGAPGVGKTTVLVKMAAQHVQQYGSESIVLICADTRRIGAFEELQAYGRILGVPTVHAHDTEELESLLSAFRHKQLVLIDHTLPEDSDSVTLPSSLLGSQSDDTVRHLFILAAGLQSAMVDELILRNCKGMNMQCVLTHLDTSARLGELFNPIIRHHLPIAYWTDAASVQQPLQKADASVLVATAVAMRRRIEQSADDKWLHRLIQPTQQLVSSLPNAPKTTRTTN
jgi:flagellar biosynthesis GTPase FlhF